MKAFPFMAVLGASLAVMGVVSVAHAQVIVTSATYGQYQTPAPGFPGAKCSQRSNIDLKTIVSNYCDTKSTDGICLYKVPWPSQDVDPGYGCYKSFDIAYRCSGSNKVRTKTVGGITDEAANQVVEIDCSQVATGIGLPSLRSNGNTVSEVYTLAPSQIRRTTSNVNIAIQPSMSKVSEADAQYDATNNYFRCPTVPLLTAASNGFGYIAIEYQVTGFSGAADQSQAKYVRFSLKVNGTPCFGSFDYTRTQHNPVAVAFFLNVNDVKIPLNIDYQAPQTVSPTLVNTSTSMMLVAGRIKDAIIANDSGPRNFGYDLVYRNKHGLAAAGNFSCTFGNSGSVSFVTDETTGLARIRGTYTVRKGTRDANGNMRWSVTTSLTGAAPIFTMESGQEIGSVTCKSSDNPAAVYSYDLGTW